MTRSPTRSDAPTATQPPLLQDIRSLIDATRTRVAARVNAEITALYWQVGRRVHVEVLQGERAGYGQRLIPQLSQALTQAYSSGWGVQHLRHCVLLAQVFPDEEIVYTLCRELSWSHIRALMYIDEPLKREFYIELCKQERWSVRQLQERIQSMLFERTAISKKPEQTIQNDLQALRSDGKLSADLAFRDPYVLDFLGLHDNYSALRCLLTNCTKPWRWRGRGCKRHDKAAQSPCCLPKSVATGWQRYRVTPLPIPAHHSKK